MEPAGASLASSRLSGERSASLFGPRPPCVVDQDAPIRGRGQGEEVRPVLERCRGARGQAQKRLVHEGGRLKRVPRSFSPEVALRETPELLVHEGHEVVQGLSLSLAVAREKPGHFPLGHLLLAS